MQGDIDAHKVCQSFLCQGGSPTYGEVAAVQTQRLSNLLKEHEIGQRPAKWCARATVRRKRNYKCVHTTI